MSSLFFRKKVNLFVTRQAPPHIAEWADVRGPFGSIRVTDGSDADNPVFLVLSLLFRSVVAFSSFFTGNQAV